MRKVFWFAVLAAAILVPACRAPKKVMTEQDKQQVKDSVLTEVPTGEGIVALNANFDDKVLLAAVAVNKQRVKPGESVLVTLYWKSLVKLEGDWKIFVHLDSSKSRKTFDHYAVNNLYQTQSWNPGEVLKDDFMVQIDQDYPSGPARLWVGLFDVKAWREEKKNVRLPVKDAGQARGDKESRVLAASLLVGAVEDKKLVAHKATARPVIDGKLDEAQWQQAFADTGKFSTTDGKPMPETEGVEAGMLWDDQGLYLAFRVKDADLRSPYKERDATLWSGGKQGASDVVEFYFDPDMDGRRYLELQVSPAGVVFDALFESYRAPEWKKASGFNLNIEVKAVMDGTLNDGTADRGYVVEAAIPWKDLPDLNAAAPVGKRLGVNFLRLSNSGTWAAAWAPVGNDFHDLSLAGTVTLGD